MDKRERVQAVTVVACSSSSSSDPPSTNNNASSWPQSLSSLQDQWSAFQDQQRMDRLATCLQLDQILKECRRRRRTGSTASATSTATVDPIESISPGLRTMKYFGWRGILTTLKETANNEGTEEDLGPSKHADTTATTLVDVLREQIQSSCAREQHAVWACRAVATGCGKDLAALKKCFEEGGDHDKYDILTVPHHGYDNTAPSHDQKKKHATKIPCYQAQQTMGACVTANARELLGRKQQREKKSSSTSSSSTSSSSSSS